MKKNISQTIPFQPDKELGQNFLFDKNYLQKIVENCPVDSNTIVIEIGSGYGSLTDLLAKTNCQKVISLEKDKKLFQWLEENKKNSKIIYLCQDALSVDWKKFCLEYKNYSLIIVGNLPYYITNSLIINLLFQWQLFKSLVFLIQKEVGQKWASSPSKYSSKYSALSVFINYLTKVEVSFEVPARVFTPSPSVDGALVVVKPHNTLAISSEQLVSFLRFLKNCFCFRRKTLLNNLNGFAENREKYWEKFFLENNYPPKIRPQNLTPEKYWELFLCWK